MITRRIMGIETEYGVTCVVDGQRRLSPDEVARYQAGDRIVEELVIEAENRLNLEGVKGEIHLFKNNIDSVGNSYGCHENFSISRKHNFESVVESMIPFLITRQIFCGSGKWVGSGKTNSFHISQRAEHMWESISSATTRSRPIINSPQIPKNTDVYT